MEPIFCGSLLAGCLLAGSVSASAALSPVQQYPQGKFTDVPESAWFAGTVEGTALILPSSTPDSTKRFRITVDDSGTITAEELVE